MSKPFPQLPVMMMPKPSRDRKSRRKQRAHNRKNVVPIKNLVQGSSAEIHIYEEISDWWGIGAADVAEALEAIGDVDELYVRINSIGGSVFEGFAIYNQLVRFNAKIIVDIDGAALSAASFIAMAGDTIRMAEASMMMIHKPWSWTFGNADELREMVNLLDKLGDTINGIYARQTGMTVDEIRKMQEPNDYWMSAEEAKELGFVDEITHPEDAEETDDEFAQALASRDYGRCFSERVGFGPTSLNHLEGMVAAIRPQNTPVDPPENEENRMPPELRQKCVAAGMDPKLKDAAANQWFAENHSKVLASDGDGGDTTSTTPTDSTPTNDNTVLMTPEQVTQLVTQGINAHAEQTRVQREEHRNQADSLIEVAFAGQDPPDGLRDRCHQAEDIDAVRKLLIDARSNETSEGTYPVSGGIRFADSQPRDEFIRDASTALIVRSHESNGYNERLERDAPRASQSQDWARFQNIPLVELARQSLVVDGLSPNLVNRLSNMHVAMAALGFGYNVPELRNAALHTTGSLAFITQDAINKTLLAAYEESPSTWRGPGRQAASVSDFKDIHRIKLGAVPNLPVWADNKDHNQARLANEEETYAVDARSTEISFTWRMIVNDDMDAISRLPQLAGDAASRTVNHTFWQEVTRNPTMSDGQPLFLETPTGKRFRSNFTVGAASPTTATLGAMSTKMRVMRGLNTPEDKESDDILNLTPTFLVGPAALEQTIMQLVNSIADPQANLSSAVYNTARNLTPVIEPYLDIGSSTAWYLFANPTRVDTVEVTFLQGQETPVTMLVVNEKNMSRDFVVIQTFGVKAIDHRGVQKHKGAA